MHMVLNMLWHSLHPGHNTKQPTLGSSASIKLLYLNTSYQGGQLSPGCIQAKTISHLSLSPCFFLRANVLSSNIYSSRMRQCTLNKFTLLKYLCLSGTESAA